MARKALTLGIAIVALSFSIGAAHAGSIRELGKVTAKAAILIDDETGAVLFARNPNLQLPPASTTKILTALVAVRNGALDRDVTVSPLASSMQPTKLWLKPGWVMNVEDLLYAILLNSANDASVVLAEGIGGSVPNFARLMNETASSLGATRSRFVNPSGLPGRGHYSTVHDLALIMHHALRTEPLREILSAESHVITPRRGSTRRIMLRSHNRLLNGEKFRVMGKTGWTRKAKRCFVGAASDGRREIIVAMLGGSNLWGDLERLLDYALHPEPGLETAPLQQVADARGVASFASSTASDAVLTLPRVAEAREAPSTKPRLEPRTERAEPQFRYHVQIASFRSRVKADRLRQQVAKQGYAASVEKARINARQMYRVTVRNFDSRASARQAARTLAKTYRVQPLIVAVRA
jgi:D-alanyl-D-alanine carboxypeptidase (penicillin-binding protein 5/6)